MYNLLCIKYFLFVFWLGSMLTCAMFLFTRGFLLNREVLHFQSSCKSPTSMGFCDLMLNSSSVNELNGEKILECTEENILSKQLHNKLDSTQYCFNNNVKVILLLIDALRYDFASYDDNLSPSETPFFKNKLSIIHQVLEQSPEHGKLFKFIADPPTTTSQRLNGLTTGSLPTFIDIGSNFDTPEINEDNLIDQLVRNKKNITFMGDETLSFMYPGRFKREFPYPSFNVWDLDTVDKNVKAKLQPEMQNKDWDVIIAHFLGVDHCGHRYGANHGEMKRKLLEMNEVIRDVIDLMDNNTMLFVIGDHGMTGTGEHGGDSEEEVTSAMFVYSPWPFIRGLDSTEAVRQVDLVPTLASILGVPVPFSNLGSVIINVLPSFSRTPDLKHNWEYVVTSLWTNIKQITLYIQEYAKSKDEFATEKLAEINQQFLQLRTAVEHVADETELLSFVTDSHRFMEGVRTMCEQAWAQFNTYAMSRGLVLYFLLFAFAFILIEGLPINFLDSMVDNLFIHLAYVSVILTVIVMFVLRHLEIVVDVEQNLYFCVCTVSMAVLLLVAVSNWATITNNWFTLSKDSSLTSVLCRVITLLSVVGLFSNSYIINEAFTSSFLLASLVFTSVLAIKSEPAKKVTKFDFITSLKTFLQTLRGRALVLVVVLFTLIKISLLYINCRPEQNCTIEKPLLSDSTRCLLSVVFVALFATCARLYLRSAGNLVGFSPTVIVSRYAPTAIVIAIGGFWVLQSLPRNTQHKLFEPWQLSVLPRAAMALLALSLATLLFRPLSVYHLSQHSDSVLPYDNIIPALFMKLKEVMVKRTGNDVKGYPVVFGLATAYSAAFLNLSVLLTLLAALLLDSEQGLAAVLLTLSLWLLAAISSITRHATGDIGEVPWWSVVAWGLSSLHHFYSTGHQASFSSINWNIAFLLSAGTTLTSHVMPAVLVIGNIFSSQILHAVLLPLLIIVPHTLSTFSAHLAPAADAQRAELTLFERDGNMNRSMFKLSLQYMLFFSLRVFASMLAASIHARHLMVWSIFAPKLIFEGIGFMVTMVSMLVGFFLLQRITSRLDIMLQGLQR